jgi:hypothetical protein
MTLAVPLRVLKVDADERNPRRSAGSRGYVAG